MIIGIDKRERKLIICPQSTLDEATDPWGVQVERVEVKDVRVPEQLQRAMAAEAEAAREARAKVGQEIMKQQLQPQHVYSKVKKELVYFCYR